MPDHVHEVTTERLAALKARGYRDPVSRKAFEVGDKIVLCACCQSIYLRETWTSMGGCALSGRRESQPRIAPQRLAPNAGAQPTRALTVLERHTSRGQNPGSPTRFRVLASRLAQSPDPVGRLVPSLPASGDASIHASSHTPPAAPSGFWTFIAVAAVVVAVLAIAVLVSTPATGLKVILGLSVGNHDAAPVTEPRPPARGGISTVQRSLGLNAGRTVAVEPRPAESRSAADASSAQSNRQKQTHVAAMMGATQATDAAPVMGSEIQGRSASNGVPHARRDSGANTRSAASSTLMWLPEFADLPPAGSRPPHASPLQPKRLRPIPAPPGAAAPALAQSTSAPATPVGRGASAEPQPRPTSALTAGYQKGTSIAAPPLPRPRPSATEPDRAAPGAAPSVAVSSPPITGDALPNLPYRVRRSLAELGIAPKLGAGATDSQLEDAIRAFQTRAGLPADGKLSGELLRHLEDAIHDRRYVSYGTEHTLVGTAFSNRVRARLAPSDVAIMSRAYSVTLESQRTGTVFPWYNSATGHEGFITITGTFPNWSGESRPCREYRQQIIVDARREKAEGFLACRSVNGSWRLQANGRRS